MVGGYAIYNLKHVRNLNLNYTAYTPQCKQAFEDKPNSSYVRQQLQVHLGTGITTTALQAYANGAAVRTVGVWVLLAFNIAMFVTFMSTARRVRSDEQDCIKEASHGRTSLSFAALKA